MEILSRAILQPPLFQALLRPAVLRDVCADLKERTQIFRVTPSLTVRLSSEVDMGIELDQACNALLARQLAAMQVHYLYDERTWCDTYLGCPSGARLVRQVIPGTLRVVAATPALQAAAG